MFYIYIYMSIYDYYEFNGFCIHVYTSQLVGQIYEPSIVVGSH